MTTPRYVVPRDDAVRAAPAARAMWRIVRALDAVPYALLGLPLRVAVATVFWRSAMVKLANFDTALALFADEYRVPLLPPALAAHLALSIELAAPVLLVCGLLTRAAAAVLLGMIAVIEIFVYPQAWPTHIQWAAMLLVLLCRGAGAWSLDAWLAGRLRRADPRAPVGEGR